LGPWVLINESWYKFAEQPDFVMEMVRAGTERAAALTKETLDQVRSALGLFSFGGG
jgi:tryptophanyl-tRNA synthetase